MSHVQLAPEPSIHRHQSLTVDLGPRSYDILISFGWLNEFGRVLQKRGLLRQDVMIFTSPRIGSLYYEVLEKSLREAGVSKIVRHDIPDGEINKNMDEYQECLLRILENFPHPGSSPLVVNLGGGVVGDLGGFAAATYGRGLPYVQIPTSLLGCVDCGVGGKVGVNFQNVKNVIGTFHQPKLVFADLALLKTLDDREIRSGTAEVIKYGAVCDGSLFEYLEEHIEQLLHLDRKVITHVVSECYRIKADVVHKDEKDDQGFRIVLNFGHTIGHALETAAGYALTHGEAISVGMIAATRIACRLNICKEDVLIRITNLLLQAGLPISVPPDVEVNTEMLIENLQHDKKFVGGENRFVLPTTIGRWQEQRGVEMSLIREVVESLFSDPASA